MTTVQQTGSIDLAAQNGAAKTATNYMSFDSTNGLKIAQSGPSNATKLVQITPSNGILIKNDANNYAKIDSSGLAVFQGNAAVASFGGTSSQIGPDSGGHSIVSSSGMEIFTNTNTSVASFGATSRIGKASGESRMELDYHSLQMVDKEGETYFYVSDLRNENGFANVKEYFIGDGSTNSFTLIHSLFVNTPEYPITVTIDETTTSAFTYSGKTITFTNAPYYKAKISINYWTSDAIKGLTFGTRIAGSVIGNSSFTEGSLLSASGEFSHAEGLYGDATGQYSHVEGYMGRALGKTSHVEGDGNYASGEASHAEGHYTEAEAQYSHTEGYSTIADGFHTRTSSGSSFSLGRGAHAEGYQTKAYGAGSHAEGGYNIAYGDYSHAQNVGTLAYGDHQTVMGAYNEIDPSVVTESFTANNNNVFTLSNNLCEIISIIIDGSSISLALGNNSIIKQVGTNYIQFKQTIPNGITVEIKYRLSNYTVGSSKYALIIGNGTSNSDRNNALAIDWNGGIYSQAMAGVIQMFAGSTAPEGWLVCDGSAVSRTTYATLFAAIGTTWGAGDGSTTFNLPDLRGRSPIGAGTGSGLTARTLGGTVGEETHTLTVDEMPNHGHKSHYYSASGRSGDGMQFGSKYAISSDTESGSMIARTGGDGAHNNMQPSVVVNFIICTGKTS